MMARRLGVPMRLIHVAEVSRSPEGATELEAEAQRLRERGVEVTAEGRGGVPDELLVRLAQEHEARLIVVPSRGWSDSKRWLTGGVAERTAESSAVPTLVVHDPAPLAAWLSGERALRVFVGTDFTASSDAALLWVAELRHYGRCEVTAAYAGWTPEDASRLGALAFIDDSPGSEATLEHDLKAKVNRVLGEECVKVVLQSGWGRADTQLIGMAVEASADLIVIGTRQRRGLSRLMEGSVSRGVLRHAPMNVGCVPASAGQRMAVPSVAECARVLVAVDVNESHGFGAPYGYGICRRGGVVRLVHVVEPMRLPNPMIGGHYQDFPTEAQHAQRLARAESALRALAPADADARSIVTEFEILERQDAAAAVCEVAERFDADVVCVGSHNRPGLRAKALGSVSLAVLRRCRRPVLVVWPPSG